MPYIETPDGPRNMCYWCHEPLEVDDADIVWGQASCHKEGSIAFQTVQRGATASGNATYNPRAGAAGTETTNQGRGSERGDFE